MRRARRRSARARAPDAIGGAPPLRRQAPAPLRLDIELDRVHAGNPVPPDEVVDRHVSTVSRDASEMPPYTNRSPRVVMRLYRALATKRLLDPGSADGGADAVVTVATRLSSRLSSSGPYSRPLVSKAYTRPAD